MYNQLKAKLRREEKRKIVFPESSNARVLFAAAKLSNENIVTPLLIGDTDDILNKAKHLNIDLSNCMIEDPKRYSKIDKMAHSLIKRRTNKLTVQKALSLLENPNYFGTMLVYLNEADGLISGAVYSTPEAVRPALQIIKCQKGVEKASGALLMLREEERFIFADCVLNISPTEAQLAEIAIQSAKTARLFGIEPRVALLSFSTKGSAESNKVRQVSEAVKRVRRQDNMLKIDGELQFDAAFDPHIAKQKGVHSDVIGDATVFIFPNLAAGNIGSKIAERLGGFSVAGTILQGLNKPVNEVSRGSQVEDIYNLGIITAVQALQSKPFHNE